MADYDEDDKRLFIFAIGPPGAGKSTLCRWLAKDYDFTHISIGDLLHEASADNSAIAHYVDRGQLVPSDLLLQLLRETFRDCPTGCPIIVDGFPRVKDQIRGFEKVFGEPHLVLFFQCPDDIAKARVLSRGRPGDSDDTFERRYTEYLILNPPILDYYGSLRGKDKLVEVNTTGDKTVSYAELLKGLRAREEWNDSIRHVSPKSPSPSPPSSP